MADITLSKAVRSNLLSLQNTAELLSKTQERLATGLKVNSALDNPSNFFTASSLNSRAGDLSRLLDSVSNATQTIEAANNGLTAITQLIETAQATGRQALQSAGQITKNEIIGTSDALYNPQALSTVYGDNTGTGALTADAATTAAFTIGADRADASVLIGGASDLGADATLLNAGGLIAVGDVLTFEVDNGTTTGTITVTFGAAGGGDAGTIDGASTATNQIVTISVDQAYSAFKSIVATAASNLTANLTTDGTTDGAFTIAAGDSNVASLRVSAVDNTSANKSSVLAALGFDNTGTAVAGSSDANRIITRNAAFDALAANGDTLSLATGSGSTYATLGTITFGTGVSAPKTAAELATALGALSASITASVNGTNVDVSITDAYDYETGIRFSQGAGDGTLAAFALVGSDAGSVGDDGNANQSTYDPTNLLTQGAVSDGDTIDIKIGSHTRMTLTFGTGLGEIQSLAELNAALANLSGGAASVDSRGEINITSDKAQDSIVIGGTTDALASFGLVAGETNNLLTTTTGIEQGDQLNIQVGTNTLLTITFGSGVGQVDTYEELEDALNNLAGGTASIDSATGAITVKATNGADTITITSNDITSTADDAVTEAFGLTNSTTPVDPVVVDNSIRTELETQFNTLIDQINDIAEDASYNGINLLNGNDLNVLFNEDGSSKLEIKGVTFDAAGLGLNAITAGYFQTDANVESTLDALQAATDLLRGQSSTFGSNLTVVESRQDFTKNMINTLETGAANLTLADSNEEAANLLALQTRQQLSTTALSLASEADQNVLRLF